MKWVLFKSLADYFCFKAKTQFLLTKIEPENGARCSDRSNGKGVLLTDFFIFLYGFFKTILWMAFIAKGKQKNSFDIQKFSNKKIKMAKKVFITVTILFLAASSLALGQEPENEKQDNSIQSNKSASQQASKSEKHPAGKATDSPAHQLKTLDELLKQIQKDQVNQRPELKKREAQFLKARNRQKIFLNRALSELKKEEKILSSLQQVFEKQDQELSQLEEKLALTMGAMGELFGLVKQTAGETKALFENSVISAEYKNRSDFIKKISAKKNLPNTSDLEMLWFLIQQEMTESGKVSRFQEEVIKAKGTTQEQTVVRVGSFNLVSQGKYLFYDNETGRVMELVRQPSRRFLSLAKKLEQSSLSKKNIYPFGIDPSRGSLLSLLIQTPNLWERISQGGIIGYIILFLLFCGLCLSLQKYFNLRKQKKLLDLQIHSNRVLKNNPLGEIIQTFVKCKGDSQEIIELKMEEEIVKKTSQLKKGIGLIKLLSSIAPLLGLLGTVTGMIVTFQSITLFGTGDPKLMAGGISQALVTTVLGLVAAIPLVLIHSFLFGKANNLTRIFEEQILGMLSRKYKDKKREEIYTDPV